MRLSSAIFGAVLLVLAPAAPAAGPCAPRVMRPQHVSAFATTPPQTTGASPFLTRAATAGADELEIQADCLAWESSLPQRAEFIGTVPLDPALPSGAFPPSPEVNAPVFSGPSVTRVTRTFGAQPLAGLFDPAPKSRAFAFGAVLHATP